MGGTQKKKKEKKGLNSYVVIFAVIVLMALLTWFVPGGEYELDEAGYANHKADGSHLLAP